MKKILSIMLVLALVVSLTACTQTDHPYGKLKPFAEGAGRDENGYWKDIRVLDYISIFTYTGIEVPKEDWEITDKELKEAISGFLASYEHPPLVEKITDKKVKVKDGDTINIDFLGSIEGVPFDGGSTNGKGTDVTIGTTQYIDDFLEQLIGTSPGDKIDVNVTFPDDYGQKDLAGKPALFVVDVNFIHGDEIELYDDYVMEHLQGHGFGETADEVYDVARTQMQNNKVFEYIDKYIQEVVDMSLIPESFIKRFEKSKLEEVADRAKEEGMTIEDFLEEELKVEDGKIMTWIEREKEKFLKDARYELAIQAIAEDMELIATDEEVSEYFLQRGIEDFSEQLEKFGTPLVKSFVMRDKIMDLMIDNAVLLDK